MSVLFIIGCPDPPFSLERAELDQDGWQTARRNIDRKTLEVLCQVEPLYGSCHGSTVAPKAGGHQDWRNANMIRSSHQGFRTKAGFPVLNPLEKSANRRILHFGPIESLGDYQ
jgi:hypothetical protein